jgi:SAM-dependent methyltransferase
MPTACSIAAFWDAAASTFDDEADHGLHDPRVRDAWAARLGSWIPNPPGDVLDLGCGTGSLTLLLAEHGHRVVGVDLSPNMVERARRKIAAAGLDARVMVGDATAPPPLDHSFDTVLSRHLVWTLPDPTAALRRWAALPRKGGRLVLVEGRWDTQTRDNTYVDGDALPWMGGVSAETLAETLQPLVSELRVEPLTDPDLWGRAINDERYAIVATI